MTTIHPDQSLGQIVTARPSLARELERRGLDYCCGGSATLARACSDNKLNVDQVIADLEALTVDDAPSVVVDDGCGPTRRSPGIRVPEIDVQPASALTAVSRRESFVRVAAHGGEPMTAQNVQAVNR
ncbi:MAG: DUF542 domain-containing protein [Ilumatobacter sp.]